MLLAGVFSKKSILWFGSRTTVSPSSEEPNVEVLAPNNNNNNNNNNIFPSLPFPY